MRTVIVALVVPLLLGVMPRPVLSSLAAPSEAWTAPRQRSVHRYLDPRNGRWTRRDPLGDVDGQNQYRYVRNRPSSAIDPSGTVLVGLSGGGGEYLGGILHILRSARRSHSAEEGFWVQTERNPFTDVSFANQIADLAISKRKYQCERIVLFGYSKGGYLAWRTAWELAQRGVTVDYLGLIDPYNAPGSLIPEESQNPWAPPGTPVFRPFIDPLPYLWNISAGHNYRQDVGGGPVGARTPWLTETVLSDDLQLHPSFYHKVPNRGAGYLVSHGTIDYDLRVLNGMVSGINATLPQIPIE